MERSPSTGVAARRTTQDFEFHLEPKISVSLNNCRIILGAKQPSGYYVLNWFHRDKAVET